MNKSVLAKFLCCSKAKCWARCQKVVSPIRCIRWEAPRHRTVHMLTVFFTAPSSPTAGQRKNGSTAAEAAAALGTNCAPCAASSHSRMVPTAQCTASTAWETVLRAAGPVTEYPAQPSGKQGPGMR